MNQHPLEPGAVELDELTDACVAFVRDHVASLYLPSASDVDDVGALCLSFREPFAEDGRPIEEILGRLRPAFIAKSFNTAGPGYFAFIPGGGIYASALADYIALATNRYVGVAKAAPALAEIEASTVRWLASVVGYGPGAGGVLRRRAGRCRTCSQSSQRAPIACLSSSWTAPSMPPARPTSRSSRPRASPAFRVATSDCYPSTIDAVSTFARLSERSTRTPPPVGSRS